MSTVGEMGKAVGREGQLPVVEGLSVSVRVTDVKSAFGEVRYRIEPLAGEGFAWVAARRVDVS
jgi:hypothetical protein